MITAVSVVASLPAPSIGLNPWVGLFLGLLLVLINGFFVAAEFALVKVRPTQLDPYVAQGSRRGKIARHMVRHLDAYLAMFKALIKDTAGIRRPGSAALDLAYVAAGRFDGFWEIGLNAWDMAAGVLLVREAGGLVGDFSGGHDFLKTGNIVAAAPKLFPAMLREIRPHLSGKLQH